MKILLFGATGKTGLLVTQLLLDSHHEVTAYIRNPDKMTLIHSHLTVVEGRLNDTHKMNLTMKGHDAIISCLGSPSLKAQSALQGFAKHISQSMRDNSIRRIIYMASAGVDHEIKGIPGFFARLVLKNVLKDHAAAITCFKTHDFDYTILRPLGLTDGPLTHNYRISETGIPGYTSISRYDVAHCIVDTVTHQKYINKSIGLCGSKA